MANRVVTTLASLGALGATAGAHTHLIAPDGGEVLAAGSVVTVQWEVAISHPTDNWDLWYSINGEAGPFVPVAMDLAPGSLVAGDLHTFDWTVPDTPSTQVLVRVRMDTPAVDYFDESDAMLTITGVPDPFPSFCFGNGGDQLGCTDCPCMNNAPVGTVGGCLNGLGTSARLEATGDPSVSLASGATTDLRFGLTGGTPIAFCLLTSGDNLAPQLMTNPCFGQGTGGRSLALNGLRCAVTNLRRHGSRLLDSRGAVGAPGATNNPWGGEGFPALGIAGAGTGFVAGQSRYFQATYREFPLLLCMRGLNTSQAVQVTFTP